MNMWELQTSYKCICTLWWILDTIDWRFLFVTLKDSEEFRNINLCHAYQKQELDKEIGIIYN